MPSFTMDSPIGRLAVEEEDGAIVRVTWRARPEAPGTPPTRLLAEARRQLEAYFRK